jgi:CDP-diacylglycerol--glycerol-3-phosphate 3-phosphatidyltransferase
MNDATKIRLRTLLEPLMATCLALRVPPNLVTTLGLVFSILAGLLLSQGRFVPAGVMLIVAGLSDSIDGELARRTNRAHRLGAFLDSSFDRLSEAITFFGLFWFYRRSTTTSSLVFATLVVSFLVSYVRARAEGIGVECRTGLFERPVRLFILILGVFFNRYLVPALWLILVGSGLTLIQRVVHVVRASSREV